MQWSEFCCESDESPFCRCYVYIIFGGPILIGSSSTNSSNKLVSFIIWSVAPLSMIKWTPSWSNFSRFPAINAVNLNRIFSWPSDNVVQYLHLTYLRNVVILLKWLEPFYSSTIIRRMNRFSTKFAETWLFKIGSIFSFTFFTSTTSLKFLIVSKLLHVFIEN